MPNRNQIKMTAPKVRDKIGKCWENFEFRNGLWQMCEFHSLGIFYLHCYLRPQVVAVHYMSFLG